MDTNIYYLTVIPNNLVIYSYYINNGEEHFAYEEEIKQIISSISNDIAGKCEYFFLRKLSFFINIEQKTVTEITQKTDVQLFVRKNIINFDKISTYKDKCQENIQNNMAEKHNFVNKFLDSITKI